MSHRMQLPRFQRQHARGVTLIELMISIVVGMIIVAAIVAIYASSSNAGRVAQAQARMNEDANAALNLLAQELRMAGNNPKQANRTVANPRNPVYNATTYWVRGCDGTFSDVTTAANPQSLTCGGATTTLPDSLAVTYEADRYNTIPTSSGQPTDCAGAGITTVTSSVTVATATGTVTANVNHYTADNRYYIGTSTAITSPSLYCKGSNSTTQPMVENVEDMQLTYGTSPAGTGTATVAGYLSAMDVETDVNVDSTGASLAALGTSQLRWRRVITVRICLVVRSEQQIAPDANSAKYVNCQGNITTPTDLRLRRAYQTTVVLRNRLS